MLETLSEVTGSPISKREVTLFAEVVLSDEARKLAKKRIAKAIHEVYGYDDNAWPRIGMAQFIYIGQTLYEEGLAFSKYRPHLDLNDKSNDWQTLRTVFDIPYMMKQIGQYIRDGRRGFPVP